MDRLKKGYSFVHVSGKLFKFKRSLNENREILIFLFLPISIFIHHWERNPIFEENGYFFSNEAQTVIISCEGKSDCQYDLKSSSHNTCRRPINVLINS